jgi:hypothetical protein
MKETTPLKWLFRMHLWSVCVSVCDTAGLEETDEVRNTPES